jgi:carbonic anhydrase
MRPLPSRILVPRLDLGLRGRARAWRRGADRGALLAGAPAGLAALGVSLPLALLLAPATGVSALWLMAASIVGSAVAALFGGAPLALSGPGVATAAAVAMLGAHQGPGGLALACAACGALQLLAGALGLGRFVRLVPLPVVGAFVAALGGWVVLLAAPHALGLSPPADLGALDVIDHLLAGRSDASGWALLVTALACGGTLAGRRFLPRAPVGVLVLALAAALVALTGLPVPRLPDLPLALPAAPSLAWPSAQPMHFAGWVLVLWVLASSETLLSSVAGSQRLAARADPDQDLIGHGLANLALAFAGGVPVTGAAIRTQALEQAGDRGGPAAGIVHALVSVPALVLVLLADRFIPMAALAGVAIAHALPLLSPAPVRAIVRASRGQAAILAIACAVMLGKGLMAGLETGLALSLMAVLLRVGRARVTVHAGLGGAPHQLTFSGPITFLTSTRLQALERELATLDPGGVILDLRDVPTMDFTGARRLAAVVASSVDRGNRVALLGVAPACRALLLGADERGLVATRLAVTETDVDQLLERAQSFELRAHVVASFGRFREEVRERFTPLFEKLAEDQRPHTLFIGCVDSRVTPAMLTGTHPGELFVIRCLGAIVVPPGAATLGGEAAAIEYAVSVLGVRNIVVCGHSRCGAIRAVSSGQVPAGLDSLGHWLASAGPAAGDLAGPDLDQAARQATVRQLENLRRFPQVQAGLAAGALTLHAWFYDVGRAELYEWREDQNAFTVLRGPDAAG